MGKSQISGGRISEDQTAGDEPRTGASSARSLAGFSVLVIDDQRANVALLERILHQEGVGRIVGITDPRLAIEQYLAIQPDLILLDMHMPHLDGLAVLDALGRVVPAQSFVPVLVLTADATDEAKRAALAAGAKDFLTKPFDRTEAVLRVRNLLETRAMHVALQHHNSALQAELAERSEAERRLAVEAAQRVRRVAAVLDSAAMIMVFQPIVELSTGATVGVEALARFPGSDRGPDWWFGEAAAVGLGTELELLAIRSAVAQAPCLPHGMYMSVNASPTTALDPQLAEILTTGAERFVLELTEHAAVPDYDCLGEALRAQRGLGMGVAVDDAGSGYASLRHILRLRPNVIKLDIELTRDVDQDPARRALAASLVSFGEEIGATIVAEGIETASELDALLRLGVQHGQGYHLGRPGPLAAAGAGVRVVVPRS
ncbi:MAG: EAL domain-containing response regulator [Acidimicrobiales bacterium]